MFMLRPKLGVQEPGCRNLSRGKSHCPDSKILALGCSSLEWHQRESAVTSSFFIFSASLRLRVRLFLLKPKHPILLRNLQRKQTRPRARPAGAEAGVGFVHSAVGLAHEGITLIGEEPVVAVIE